MPVSAGMIMTRQCRTLAVGSAARNRISRRRVLRGFVGGIHRMYFRKKALTCKQSGRVLRRDFDQIRWLWQPDPGQMCSTQNQ